MAAMVSRLDGKGGCRCKNKKLKRRDEHEKVGKEERAKGL